MLLHVPWLLRDFTSDSVYLAWELGRVFAEAEPSSKEDQGDGDADPEHDQREHCAKGHCAAALFSSDDRVKDAEHEKTDSWESKSHQDSVLLPVMLIEGLVCSGGIIPSE